MHPSDFSVFLERPANQPTHTMNPTTLHFIRRWLAAALLFVLATLSAVPARAATGDLVVVCYNSDLNGEFALIALANLPQGARYFITDSGWSTNSNNLMQEGNTPTSVQQVQLDVIKLRGIPLGTVLKFNQSGANVVLTDPTLATLTIVNRFSASSLPLLTKLSLNANAVDQILIFQEMDNTTKDRDSAGSGGLC